MKVVKWGLSLIVIGLIVSFIYLLKTCQALEIITTHNANAMFFVISQTGDTHEPPQCNNFPLVIGKE